MVVSFAIGPVARVGSGIDLLRSRHLARKDVAHRRGDVVSVAGTPFYFSSDGEVSARRATARGRLRSQPSR
jgi:diacylglycerol kinase (ATP)